MPEYLEMRLEVTQCPQCQEDLCEGWIGERGWIRWYEHRPRGFRTILSLGERLLQFNLFGVWLGATEAKRCRGCGVVLFQSDCNQNTKDHDDVA